MDRPDYLEALERTGVASVLAAFDPHLAGTLPLGLALPSSDLDVLCHAPDPTVFTAALWDAFRHETDFSLRQWSRDGRPVIASFTAYGWPFEIFGSTDPVLRQAGWRHFLVERRLLALGGAAFRAAIMSRRAAGHKTEPAFAAELGLVGDPYAALLSLETLSDQALARLMPPA